MTPAPDYRLFDPAQPLPAATAELRTTMQGQRAEIERLEEAVRRLGVVGQPEEVVGLRQARAAMAQTRAELAWRTPGGYAVITSPLYGVPSNPIFVGRSDEVRDCGRKLKNTHPVVIWGAGGIGKTALAAEVAHRQGWRFPAGVLWLDCRGGPALDTLLDRIGAFAGIAGIAQIEPAKKLPTVRYALAGLEDRCLLVWDNAEDVWHERSVREFVQGLPANCQVLLTTRENPEVPMWQMLELRPLPDQAMMLLFGRLAVSAGVKVGACEDLDIIPPMLDWLQGHPLAVTLVVPLVAKRGLRRVWEELRRQPLKGVAAAFEVSYGRLTAVQQRVFTRAGVYTIPVQWEGIEALLPGEGDVDEALDVIVQRALVSFDGSVYSYHTLLRQYAYAKLQANEDVRPVHRLAAEYLQSLATERARIPVEVLEEVDQWERAEAWREFVSRADSLVGTLDRIGFWMEIQSRLERVLVVVREHLGAPPDLHGYVLSGLATIHLKQADWSTAEKLWQEALVLHQTANDEAGQAQTLGDLGTAYADRGNWDRAIELYQQSLAICERQGDSECIAKILGNLGNVWTDKGEWDRAIESHQQSLSIKQRTDDAQGIATTLGNLGNVYQLKGEWTRSIESYQQSLHVKERLGDFRGIAQTYNNLGVVYSDMGEWDRATECHQRSFAIYEQLGDRRGVAWTYDKIGSMYARRGDLESAIECYQRSLTIEDQLSDIQGMATTYNNLGNVYFQMADIDRTIQFHQQSLVIKENLGDIRGMAQSYHNLGLAYADKGDWDQAIEFYQKDLAVCEKLNDSHGWAQTLVSLGRVYFQKGEWDRAIESYQRSISILEHVGDIPGMAIAHHNLAVVYWNQDKKDEAISLVAQSYLVFVQLGSALDARQAGGVLVDWLGSVEAANAYLAQLMESISRQQ